MKVFFVYVLKSLSRKYMYVGITEDVKRRFDQHNKGYERTTNPYVPFELVHLECVENRVQARIREKYLKSAAGKRFLEKSIKSTGSSLPD